MKRICVHCGKEVQGRPNGDSCETCPTARVIARECAKIRAEKAQEDREDYYRKK